MITKTAFRAKKLEIISKFPQEVQDRITKVIGCPNNLLNTSNMFSAAVDSRKSSKLRPDGTPEQIIELWMMKHSLPKPKEDNTLLLISRFLMDNIGNTVSFTTLRVNT